MNSIAPVARLSPDHLPVIDVSALRGDDPAALARLAAELRAACTGPGFFYISAHGIADDLLARTLEQTRAFFALPLADKLEADKARNRFNRGYEKLRDQTLEPGMPPDVKEGFYIGRDMPLDHPDVVAGMFNAGPNTWPAALPSMKPVLEEWYAAMLELSILLMGGMALSLGLERDYFAPFNEEPIGVQRLLHYPPQPAQPLPGEIGCGAHTDWGCLTILFQDSAGGLQVKTGGRWIDAPPIPGTFVINIGDMFARWTNDLYQSNLHRVINSSGGERYSMPFFYEGNGRHLVECIPTCLGDGAKYAPVTVVEHLREMYRATYGA